VRLPHRIAAVGRRREWDSHRSCAWPGSRMTTTKGQTRRGMGDGRDHRAENSDGTAGGAAYDWHAVNCDVVPNPKRPASRPTTGFFKLIAKHDSAGARMAKSGATGVIIASWYQKKQEEGPRKQQEIIRDFQQKGRGTRSTESLPTNRVDRCNRPTARASWIRESADFFAIQRRGSTF